MNGPGEVKDIFSFSGDTLTVRREGDPDFFRKVQYGWGDRPDLRIRNECPGFEGGIACLVSSPDDEFQLRMVGANDEALAALARDLAGAFGVQEGEQTEEVPDE